MVKDFFLGSKLYVIISFLFLGTYTVSAQQEIEVPISQRVSALMAKMTLEEKNKYSHRARAFNKMIRFLNARK